MKSRSRLLGVDLLRIIAIFGVIVLHSDSGAKSVSEHWQLIRCFFGFAVPFFLATSFYLAVLKSKQNKLQLGSRFRRLFLPYIVWTALYLVYKFIKYTLDGENDRIDSLFQDPLGLIFFGSSAIHLYFLPLLIWGTIIVKSIDLLGFKIFSLNRLIVCFLGSFLIHAGIILSGNEFKIVAGTAFNNWLPDIGQSFILRLFFVFLTWSFWCLSYIFMSKIIHHPQVNKLLTNLGFKVVFCLILGFIMLTWIDYLLFYDAPIFEVFRGNIILLIAINLSKYMSENKIVANLSKCCFGIYFVHLIFIEIIYIVGNRAYPQLLISPSIILYLIISTIVLFLSWFVSRLLLTNKQTASLFLGY